MTNAKPLGDGSGTSGTAISQLASPISAPLRFSQGEAVCASPEETRALGARFGGCVVPGAVISLEGPLGAGKTQFVKGFVASLGHAGEVSSPTFTLVHEYANGAIVHFDWYRLEVAEEVAGIGWDDYLAGGGTLLVEWGDRFPELLPAGTWRVSFEIQSDSRLVRWEQTA